MKYWIHTIVIIIVSFLLSFYAPWWIIALVSMISAYIFKLKHWTAAMYGLLAGFILWAGLSFYLDVENKHILSSKIGQLFGGVGSVALVAITGLIGGILAGLGSFVGSALRLKK